MPGPQKGPHGPGKGPRGPKPQIKNPGKLIRRLLQFIMSRYGAQYVIVIICIFISVLCNTRGTMFMKSLIDDYIVPMVNSGNRDFSGLAKAIFEVGGFYAMGIVAT